MMISLYLVLRLLTFPLRPDPVLTPGDIATRSATAVCTAGYAEAHRDVSDTTKRAIYKAYGIVPTGHFVASLKAASGRRWQSDFEVDHLISLQLGGSNKPRNLWIQSYGARPNAYDKDDLENRLHWLVCHGQLRLVDAQRMIREDWIAAYGRYFALPPSTPTLR